MGEIWAIVGVCWGKSGTAAVRTVVDLLLLLLLLRLLSARELVATTVVATLASAPRTEHRPVLFGGGNGGRGKSRAGLGAMADGWRVLSSNGVGWGRGLRCLPSLTRSVGPRDHRNGRSEKGLLGI